MPNTPGPWFVDGKVIKALASGQIAQVGGDFYDDGRKDASGWTFTPPLDTAANARLIAAAPDLLRELKRLLEMWEEAIGWEKDYMDMGDDARAAITKAEGGE